MSEKKGARLWEDQRGDSQTLHQAVPSGTQTQAQVTLTEDIHVINDNSVYVRKLLGQDMPGTTTLTDLYVCPSGKTTEVSTIYICETDGSPATFRISVAVNGAADDTIQYIFLDQLLAANETIQLNNCGIMLGDTDVLRVYSDTGNVVFNAFGIEVT